MYEVILGKQAKDSLKKLPKEISRRIGRKLEIAREDPFHFFIRLVGYEHYKLRVGDYRVIADIDTSGEIIKIRAIRHRKNVYEKWIFNFFWRF